MSEERKPAPGGQDQERVVSRFGNTEATITKDKITELVRSIDEDEKVVFPIMCPHCGQENPEFANFCRRCGVKLKDVCDCWIKKRPYNCVQRRCPGYKIYLTEK